MKPDERSNETSHEHINAKDYHERTKHSLQKYAAAPGTLDWSMQPDPFRHFEGCQEIPLPLLADTLQTPYTHLYHGNLIETQPWTLDAIAILFELSMGLSAWKQYGPDKWALRCNPSSGNLHPTEAYLVNWDKNILEPGVYHYRSDQHQLEKRCTLDKTTSETLREMNQYNPGVVIGLSSIHWREAWKYGERAYRYCQLDIGHAIATISYAAASLGWHVKHLDNFSDVEVSTLLGLEHYDSFSDAEHEKPDVLLYISPNKMDDDVVITSLLKEFCNYLDNSDWTGKANRLDHHPMYQWPVIEQVSQSTVKPETLKLVKNISQETLTMDPDTRTDISASKLIRQRRSAQAFDNSQTLPLEDFYRIIDKLLPRNCCPWNSTDMPDAVHPVFYIHRVDGLKPGLYALPRNSSAKELLEKNMRAEFKWTSVENCPQHLPFYELITANSQNAARTVSCHQDIAADSAFCVSMLAEFKEVSEGTDWYYRYLHWQAGMLGHVLYLEAEAINQRGTGIGCFFDDAVHNLLGIETDDLQVIYHFTLGTPVVDQRLISLPPYGHLSG